MKNAAIMMSVIISPGYLRLMMSVTSVMMSMIISPASEKAILLFIMIVPPESPA